MLKDRLLPSNKILNTLIYVCAQNRDLMQAVRVWNILEKTGHWKPSLYSYVSIISACARVGDTESALKYF
eukprot:UN11193